MKEWAPANLTFLSGDGATISFIVVGEPLLLTGRYKGKEQERIGCPIVTDEGFSLFVTGKRTARKLAYLEDQFTSHVIMVTRHGVEEDTNAKYEVVALPDTDKFNALQEVARASMEKDSIAQAVKDALEVMNQ